MRKKVPALPPMLVQVILTALAKDPKERFGSVRAFATAFEHAGQDAALVFHAGQAAPPAFEPHSSGLAQADPIESAIGTTGQGLPQHRLHMIGNPVRAQGSGRLMRRVFRKAVLLPQRAKCPLPFIPRLKSEGSSFSFSVTRAPGILRSRFPSLRVPEPGLTSLAACLTISTRVGGEQGLHPQPHLRAAPCAGVTMAEDRVGQRLGNYRLTRHLGEGGFADVYLGTHLYLKTQAAIKVLHTRLADDDRERFLNEARTIARLSHPHIVRVLDFGVERSTPFLVMEYAPHGTLRQRHRKGTRLDPAVIASYLMPLADALHYAHEHQLVHRDVKPENILIGERGEIVLSDFGIAVVTHSTHQSGPSPEIAGTVVYMAPEQVQGKPRPSSDQYALGIMAYEWLTGTRPFEGSFIEIATQQVLAPPPPLHEHVADIPPALEAAVLQALAKDPKERFASVLAFAQAFAQASEASLHSTGLTPAPKGPDTPSRSTEEGAPTMVLPHRPPRRTRPVSPRARRPRSWAIPAMLLLLVLLSSGIGVFLATRPQAAPATTQSRLPPTPTPGAPTPTPTPPTSPRHSRSQPISASAASDHHHLWHRVWHPGGLHQC